MFLQVIVKTTPLLRECVSALEKLARSFQTSPPCPWQLIWKRFNVVTSGYVAYGISQHHSILPHSHIRNKVHGHSKKIADLHQWIEWTNGMLRAFPENYISSNSDLNRMLFHTPKLWIAGNWFHRFQQWKLTWFNSFRMLDLFKTTAFPLGCFINEYHL